VWNESHAPPAGGGAAVGRQPSPAHRCHRGQSVVDTAEGGEERWHDAGKQITGRKRTLAVDTLGLLLKVVVRKDYDGATSILARMKLLFTRPLLFTRIKVLFADSA
jgi:putative transposase